MYQFGEKHPVIMEIILLVISFMAAAAVVVAGSVVGMHSDLSSSIGRVIAGAGLYFVYRRAFEGNRLFGNPVYLIPALLFAAWNVFYNLSSGKWFGGPYYYLEALVTAIAPAVYEEVLFRGIFIYNLKKKGHGALVCMLISAAVFALVHLTNIAGQAAADVALQAGYSFVVGLVFAAVYLKNNSLLEIVFAHFMIDFTNRIFNEQAASASMAQIAVFAALLAGEAVWAIRMGKRIEGHSTPEVELG